MTTASSETKSLWQVAWGSTYVSAFLTPKGAMYVMDGTVVTANYLWQVASGISPEARADLRKHLKLDVAAKVTSIIYPEANDEFGTKQATEPVSKSLAKLKVEYLDSPSEFGKFLDECFANPVLMAEAEKVVQRIEANKEMRQATEMRQIMAEAAAPVPTPEETKAAEDKLMERVSSELPGDVFVLSSNAKN